MSEEMVNYLHLQNFETFEFIHNSVFIIQSIFIVIDVHIIRIAILPSINVNLKCVEMLDFDFF